MSYRSGHKHIHRDDTFTRAVEKVVEYYTKSPLQSIITTVAVVGIIVVGVIILTRITGKKEKVDPVEAKIALKVGQEYLTKDLRLAEDTLQYLATKFPRTASGEKAIFYLGQALFMEGRYEEALEHFTRFEKQYSIKKSFMRPSALYAQGNCLEELGQYEDAVTRYIELTKKYPESGLLPQAYLGAGRCLVAARNLVEAESLYTKLAKDYPEYKYPEIYRKAKGALGEIGAMKNMF